MFAIYGVCAAGLRDKVLSRPRLVDRIRKTFAATFVALSARLAVERVSIQAVAALLHQVGRRPLP